MDSSSREGERGCVCVLTDLPCARGLLLPHLELDVGVPAKAACGGVVVAGGVLVG